MEAEVSGVAGARDCFAALPLNIIDALQGPHRTEVFKAILELRLLNATNDAGPWYLAWAGATSSSSSIEISKRLADCLGLPCGARFHVRALRDVANAETVEVEPATEDDWEILELNAGFAENHILSQVGVLCCGQRFPVWVEGGNILMLHVVAAKPRRVVQLVSGSELLIAPKLRKVFSPSSKPVFSKESSFVKAILRVQELHPSSMQPLDNVGCSSAPTRSIFVSKKTAEAFSLDNGQLVVVSAHDQLPMQEEDFEKDKTRNLKDKTVSSDQATPVVLSTVYCDLVAKGHAMLASSLCHLIGAPNHSRVDLKSYSESLMESDSSADQIKLKSTDDLLIDSLQDNLGSLHNVANPLKANGLEDKRDISLSSLTWLKAPASLALERLQVSLSPELQAKGCKLGLTPPGYVLLHGPPACGKTKLALAIAKELEKNPSILCHIVMVKCGTQAQGVRTAIQEAVYEGVKNAPSLIILDDLDMAIPSNLTSESSEPSTSSLVLAEYLSDLLDTFRVKRRHQFDRCVSFLALAKEVTSLPTPLCSSGRFDLHIALSAPTTTQRAAILSHDLENRGLVCSEGIVSEIASKCDGYDAAELELLIDRVVQITAPRLLHGECLKKKTKGHSQQDSQRQIFKEDFEQALDGFLPVSMRDLAKSSKKGGSVTWKDVGGLNDTCRALQEMLELPVKYSKLFSKAPLRLRTGVLLYGPPGCGKTHVVGIAAAACSLRLISVKGPEILNKYIGASEQGVRDLFTKASAAAPCILFFDEFDAIAPKRGHDNTGVTDRVVNQLLTELDGVEALNGVFVFAATSRPDLLDAALLRPGRLDRLLLCDLPTASERLEILQVLSRELCLADDVRLDSVASLTENFSGADLQAVLVDAQYEAIHSHLSNEPLKDGTVSNEPKKPIITMADLSSAILKARPSVSDQERCRLYNIYESFISSRSSITDKTRDAKGKRATLA
ncbi:hypothetical protein L7F22_013236 [Adiantum nelumboides]|nr:hypothetical protein [Adiantum nelumboides]